MDAIKKQIGFGEVADSERDLTKRGSRRRQRALRRKR
jgi:hypothetical protein